MYDVTSDVTCSVRHYLKIECLFKEKEENQIKIELVL
jgi:hypothetical protein